MERALVAISILLAAGACAAQEPQADAPAATAIAASTGTPAAADPSVVDPSVATSGAAVPNDSSRTAENAAQASAVATEGPVPSAESTDSLLAAGTGVPAGAGESNPAAEQATAPQAPERAHNAVPADTASPLPTVDLNKLTDDTVCRKERPTGSLIGVTRCYSRSAANNNDNELMKRDVEEIRRRQNDRLAREAAAAMSRGRSGL